MKGLEDSFDDASIAVSADLPDRTGGTLRRVKAISTEEALCERVGREPWRWVSDPFRREGAAWSGLTGVVCSEACDVLLFNCAPGRGELTSETGLSRVLERLSFSIGGDSIAGRGDSDATATCRNSEAASDGCVTTKSLMSIVGH